MPRPVALRGARDPRCNCPHARKFEGRNSNIVVLCLGHPSPRTVASTAPPRACACAAAATAPGLCSPRRSASHLIGVVQLKVRDKSERLALVLLLGAEGCPQRRGQKPRGLHGRHCRGHADPATESPSLLGPVAVRPVGRSEPGVREPQAQSRCRPCKPTIPQMLTNSFDSSSCRARRARTLPPLPATCQLQQRNRSTLNQNVHPP